MKESIDDQFDKNFVRIPVSQRVTPIELGEAWISKFLYFSSENTFIDYNIDPREVESWTISLANGRIPVGFNTIEEFERYIQDRIFGKKGDLHADV